jgi:histidine ammonia-lyase
VYGVNTGFGNFASVKIDADKVSQLQLNLIRSHCAGVGEPLTPSRTRMVLALRINTLCKGYSGIRSENLQYVMLYDGFQTCVQVVDLVYCRFAGLCAMPGKDSSTYP